ncbi:sigma-70 family RNA polymerase sigma factor [Parapedobacter sp. ISTM3]|uniref:RNA polymerase sigma-70 factor, ECF subfamily n=1 Tax=Parapedobacter luteus TaxID=623280 RepID=A0A1T5F3C9_9SPHI|nr:MULTISPECIES: sigma-70 family RNA polymerase sigma factor [Parapedobacter]MBK1442205.1 sigma-70 family RNA polymerase sigma factor [Parapedobacter sp. ISTM3]SKB90560.1 RNA polymerase sigma-70 factor, ECF subfamily [Parapedobacter luteus]
MQPVEKKDEIELIALCREGHEVGFTELYNKYARSVYNSICRIISHTGEAEDILQESFYHAFADIHRLHNAASFGAWVNRIALNRSITYLRKQKVFFTDAEEMDIADEEGYDEEANTLFDCKVDDVKNAIEQLPQGYKTILSLYLFEDIPQEEIGKMLGISHTTVRSQYHRAKKRIIQSLKDKTLS